MRKNVLLLVFMVGCLITSIYGQNQNGCVNGQRNGITYTDCWQDATDDTARLQAAISLKAGKVIFNESNYEIYGHLNVYSYRILEGTTTNPFDLYGGSNIKQKTNGESIFLIGEGIYDVAIRDMALVGGATQTIGIKANGTNGSSQNFQFSNLRFHSLNKGIYVEANNGEFQFDNVKLDHADFTNCMYAVHLNSHNSGWHISSINIAPPKDGIGFYFEKSTYTSISLVIGNGNTGGDGNASKLFWITSHANISIQNSTSENFNQDVYIDSAANEGIIYLMNNYFQGGVTVNNAQVVSIGNTFVSPGYPPVSAIAMGNANITSIGDKFCAFNTSCSNKWDIQGNARKVFETNPFGTITVGKTSAYGLTSSSANSATNGSLIYCEDCQQTNSCSSGGNGAMAVKIQGSWRCN